MLHDGKLLGVTVYGSGLVGLAWAGAQTREELQPLVDADLCKPITKGGTVRYVAELKPHAIGQVEPSPVDA